MKGFFRGGIALAVLGILGCTPEPVVDLGDFPEDIGKILVTNCATAGCHDEQSNVFEGRLSLAGWENMFRGSRAGAAVIPYRADQSYLLFFVNNDSTLGITQKPRMPFNQAPLSADEYIKLRDWVIAGAPSAAGNVKFADNPRRNKFYIANQGCDLVTVFDLGSGLAMRYVDVGQTPGFTESPHMIRVSPDGEYWYVVFLATNPFIEKYRASDDSYVGTIQIGVGDWNTLTISEDGKYAFAVAYANQKIQVADLVNMTALPVAINTPEKVHGQAIHPDFTSLYVTQQDRSRLYKLSFTDPMSPDALDEICLTAGCIIDPRGEMQPHEVAFTPDGSKYLVSCQGATIHEVRIFNTANDSLLYIVPVGNFPSEFTFDPVSGLAFVTCMEDVITFASDPNKHGSVAVINYETGALVKSIYTGYQPHGIEADVEGRVVYVTNRNVNPNGPAPHHTTACGGRNGYVTAIDLNTLTLIPNFKAEVSSDPYSVAIRRTQ